MHRSSEHASELCSPFSSAAANHLRGSGAHRTPMHGKSNLPSHFFALLKHFPRPPRQRPAVSFPKTGSDGRFEALGPGGCGDAHADGPPYKLHRAVQRARRTACVTHMVCWHDAAGDGDGLCKFSRYAPTPSREAAALAASGSARSLKLSTRAPEC